MAVDRPVFVHYDGHMTYFETPNDQQAHVLGMSVEAYEDMQDQIVADLENLDMLGNPDIDPEDRNVIAWHDVDGGEVPADALLNDERFDRHFFSVIG